MVAAVSRICIPVDGAVGGDLEGGIAFFIQVLAIVGFDCCRIDGVFGRSHPSGCHERARDSHKPDFTKRVILPRSDTEGPGPILRAGTIWSHCASASPVSVPPSAV